MSTDSATHDLEYLRELAESGRNAPLLGGRFLAWWGGLLTVAYLGHFLLVTGSLGLPSSAFAWLWIAFAVMGYAGHFVLLKNFSEEKPGVGAVGNQVQRIVWVTAGIALFAFFASLAIKSVVIGQAAPGFAYSLPLVFTAYGIALTTTGYLGQSTVLRRAGGAALILVAVSTLLVGSGFDWLLASIGAALTVFLPGVLLMRKEPR